MLFKGRAPLAFPSRSLEFLRRGTGSDLGVRTGAAAAWAASPPPTVTSRWRNSPSPCDTVNLRSFQLLGSQFCGGGREEHRASLGR